MTLQLYNSMTKTKMAFHPKQAGQVNLYVCGMTVYDFCHLGHARSMLVFDLLYRYLQFLGFQVNYVRNITDIDDKIIQRAHEANEPIQSLTERMIDVMHEDFQGLHLLSPTSEPRATAHVPHMIQIIEALMKKGLAYQGEHGDVYYAVNQFKDYGKLSHRKLADMRAGERVAVAKDKKDPLDFVLWKAAKPDEPAWDSPWGKGRPGWHLECSAMSLHCFDETVDIHGGGMDLMFPHHENEIAQTEGVTARPFEPYWMHVGFLQINDEKMSKSLGNFLTIREVLKSIPAETLRYFMLATHYRSPFNYSEDGVKQAHQSLERFYTAIRGLDLPGKTTHSSDYTRYFQSAMNDDLNTPNALSVLFELAHAVNRARENQNRHRAEQLALELKQLGGVFGILQESPELFLQRGFQATSQSNLMDEDIEAMIQARNQARAEKDWKKADDIRDKLKAEGVVLEDKSGRTTWRRH